jgi:hypothetical protein
MTSGQTMGMEDTQVSGGAALGEPAGLHSEAERNAVFAALVSGDSDIVGLIAYSIYKQNKLDWLVAFGKQRSREPNEAEVIAYIIGESTPRRLAIYRHLAQATLEGRGPDVAAGGVGAKTDYSIAMRPQSARTSVSETGRGTIIAFAGLVIVALVAVYFAARFGIPGIVSAR